jgi:hypothetical protein
MKKKLDKCPKVIIAVPLVILAIILASLVLTNFFIKKKTLPLGSFCTLSSRCQENYDCVYFKCIEQKKCGSFNFNRKFNPC